MISFELDILDEKSHAGSEFMDRVARELRRALMAEKASRRITQQAIAEKIGTSRAVVNREVQGLENLTSRRIGELFWALGWEPYFEARKIPDGDNYSSSRQAESPSPTPPRKSGYIQSEPDPIAKQLLDEIVRKQNPAPTPVS
jgi:hypothetical protein